MSTFITRESVSVIKMGVAYMYQKSWLRLWIEQSHFKFKTILYG